MTMTAGTKGKIVQVIGTVVDIEFPPDQLPAVYNAVEIDNAGETSSSKCSSTSATTG